MKDKYYDIKNPPKICNSTSIREIIYGVTKGKYLDRLSIRVRK